MHSVCTIILLLTTVAVYARPSANVTSQQWRPVEIGSQPLRYTPAFREFVPIKHYTTLNNVLKTRKSPANRRKVQVKYKIANATTLKHPNATQVLSDRDKLTANISDINKSWPNSAILSLDHVQSYNNYFMSTKNPLGNDVLNIKRRPIKNNSQHVFTKVSENLYSANNSKWYEIKVKPIAATTVPSLHANLDPLPVEVIENSNPFPIQIPGVHIADDVIHMDHASNNGANLHSGNIYYQSSTVGSNINSNNAATASHNVHYQSSNVHTNPTSNFAPTSGTNIENLSNNVNINHNQTNLDNIYNFEADSNSYQVHNSVTQSPDQTHIINKVHLTPNTPNNTICPSVSITSNTFYNNKELCPDLDIVINNQIQTSNNNVFTDLPLDEAPVDYDANSSDLVSLEDNPDTNPILEYDDVATQGDSLETEVLDDGLGESASSAGSQTPSSSTSNRPQLPNLPTLAQNDASDSDNGGIFDTGVSILNSINLPFLALILAPLALIMTGTLGLTTFFIPWTVFPTIFLSRKATDTPEPLLTHDGWFWHTKYKTWTSLSPLDPGSNRAFTEGNVGRFILRLIDAFGKKYDNRSWKRRKK